MTVESINQQKGRIIILTEEINPILNLGFLLVAKFAPYYWDDHLPSLLHKEYNPPSFIDEVSQELVNEGISSLDADPFAIILSRIVQQHLHDFSPDASDPSEFSSNPRLAGLRKEDVYNITGLLNIYFPEDCQIDFMNRYKNKFPGLLKKLNQDTQVQKYFLFP